MLTGILFVFAFLSTSAFADFKTCQLRNEISGAIVGANLPTLSAIELMLSKDLPKTCGQLQKLQSEIKIETGGNISLIQNPAPKIKEKMKAAISAFDRCHSELMKKCYPNRKSTVSKGDLDKIYETLKTDLRFRQEAPNASCFGRAYLLGKFLTQSGFQVKTVSIRAPSIIGVQRQNGKWAAYKYQVHAVVKISARESDGSTKNYILDPQFEDAPVPEATYRESTLGIPCTSGESNAGSLCEWLEGEPTQSLRPISPAFPTRYSASLLVKDPCGWSQTNDAEAILNTKVFKDDDGNEASDLPYMEKVFPYDGKKFQSEVMLLELESVLDKFLPNPQTFSNSPQVKELKSAIKRLKDSGVKQPIL